MSAHELADSGRIEDDAVFIWYHRGHGRSWLLKWNYANPEDDDRYEAFSSEKDLRAWCREELGYVQWRHEGALWSGVVRGTVEEEE